MVIIVVYSMDDEYVGVHMVIVFNIRTIASPTINFVIYCLFVQPYRQMVENFLINRVKCGRWRGNILLKEYIEFFYITIIFNTTRKVYLVNWNWMKLIWTFAKGKLLFDNNLLFENFIPYKKTTSVAVQVTFIKGIFNLPIFQ